MSKPRCDQVFGEAFRILLGGFPIYAEREFERARRVLGAAVTPDMAAAIVSDLVLLLSQLGLGLVASCREPESQADRVVINMLAALQHGELRAAELTLHRIIGYSGPAHMLPLRVLANRLAIAGLRLRYVPELRVIQGAKPEFEAGRDIRGMSSHLKLVSSS